VSRYQKGKTNLDFTEARDTEWQWHQLGHMQVCTSLQTDSHASTPPPSFLQAGCPSCRPANSIKALKAWLLTHPININSYLQRSPLSGIHVLRITHRALQTDITITLDFEHQVRAQISIRTVIK